MSDFGDFLYELRKEKGITQAELAEILGVTNKAVSKWETGESMPETGLLLPLSRIFGVTVDELLSGARADVKEQDSKATTDNGKSDEYDEARGNSGNCHTDKAHCYRDGNDKKQYVRVEHGDTVVTVVADDLDDLDGVDGINLKRHIFAREKDGKQTLLDKIWGTVFASLALIGILTYVLIGTLTGVWHPTWVIIPCFILSSGILGCVFDMCNSKKRDEKIKRGENPYTGGVCGVIMLACIIAFLLLGSFAGLWHPCWAILVIGAVICGIVGAIGDVIAYKRKNRE